MNKIEKIKQILQLIDEAGLNLTINDDGSVSFYDEDLNIVHTEEGIEIK